MVFDDVDELDNLYVASGAGQSTRKFYLNFWNSEAFEPDEDTTGIQLCDDDGSLGPYTANGIHTLGVKTEDIKEQYAAKAYPVTDGTVTVSIYGWC